MTKYSSSILRIMSGLTLSLCVGTALLITLARNIEIPGIPIPENTAHQTVVPKKITDPPREGHGQEEYNRWVEAGMPGYIPDQGSVKNGNPGPADPPAPPPVVYATCQRTQTAADLGLSADAGKLYETICALFPQITTFYGYRAGDQDHGTGNALDSMVYDDTATGNELAQFLIDNAGDLNIKYIIWQQRIWMPGQGWTAMADRGSPTANHYDHVHTSVN